MNKGKLYVCGTPIGNLEDISLRVLRILKEVDYIGAEDTRHSKKLLSHYNIQGRLFSCYEHNEKKRSDFIIDKLEDGLDVALISNAGMPVISDPGTELIGDILSRGYELEIIPGVSAVTTAIAASAFSGNQFCFLGFLPRQKEAREKQLGNLQNLMIPLVFFESPKRLIKTLEEFIDLWGGGTRAIVARELTKYHEEITRGTLEELAASYKERDEVLGEITLVIDSSTATREEEGKEESIERLIEALFAGGSTNSEIISLLQPLISWPRNKIYRYVLDLKEKSSYK